LTALFEDTFRRSEAEDRIIYEAFIMGKSYQIMNLISGRSTAVVRQRLRHLGLIDSTSKRIVDVPLFAVIQARRHAAKSTIETPLQQDGGH
jgi:hypothetical protein